MSDALAEKETTGEGHFKIYYYVGMTLKDLGSCRSHILSVEHFCGVTAC